MATVTVNDSNLYDIADSIRAKLGVQTTYKPSEMADAIDSISGGGITPTGEIEITANGTYDVTQYASAEVDVPQSGITPTGTINITENGTYDVINYADADVNIAVDNDLRNALITGEFDKSYTIPGSKIGRGFANCTGEYDIVFPNVTTLRQTNYTFEATTFNSMNFPSFAGALKDALRNYKGKHFIAPNAISLGAADGCSNLIDIFIPNASLATKSLSNNANLEIAVVGSFGKNTYQAFWKCSKLSVVDICLTSDKIDNVFQTCPLLNNIIIRQDSIIELYNITAFDGTPFASGGSGGTIYIPESLYNHLNDGTSFDYKSASNWATIDGYGTITWAKIEGSYYETHYADGTNISS